MKKAGMLVLLLAAGAAQAKDVTSTQLWTGISPNGGLSGSGRVTQTLNVDVTGIYSYDPFGDVLNTVLMPNIGANSHVTGIGFDVTLYADSPSWLSELRVEFTDSAISTGVGLTPGVGVNSPGTGSYSSGGVIDLVGLALDFTVGGDGVLRMEFWETYDDWVDDWDGIWQSGTLTIQYEPIPAPGALALLGFGGIAALRRRR